MLVDDNDMEDGDAVMVDALEALRLAQPHTLANDRLSQLTQAAESTSDRPHTAKGGGRHSSVLSSEVDSSVSETERQQPNGDNRADGAQAGNEGGKEGHQSDRPRNSIWALFGSKDKSRHDAGPPVTSHAPVHPDASSSAAQADTSRLTEDSEGAGGNNKAIEATDDSVKQENSDGQSNESNEQLGFSSSQFWKTPLVVPDEIEAA